MRCAITEPARRRRAGSAVLAVLVACGLGARTAPAQDDLPWMDRSLPAPERTELLLDALRLDEKIQQIANRIGYNAELDDGDPGNGGPCDIQRTSRHIEGLPALGIPTMRFCNKSGFLYQKLIRG
jgi:beta-glucosidase